MNIKSKREREKETVSLMIAIYCRKKHGGKTLCPECADKTVVLVSHRKSTMGIADTVYSVEHGRMS